MAYLSRKELESIGFAEFGEEVLISDKVSIYNPSKISIGSFVRIDDFCVISAGDEGIDIGNYVHISCHATLIGQAKITIQDFVAISIKSTIVSSTSDFSGEYFPKITAFGESKDGFEDLFSVISKPVTMETHTGLGAHSLILPGVTIGKGSAIGALSVVYESVNPWGIYLGNPVRFVKKRSEEAYNKLQERIEMEKTHNSK